MKLESTFKQYLRVYTGELYEFCSCKENQYFTKMNTANLSMCSIGWNVHVNESFFAMKSDFRNRNGDETYKFREICYQTD